MIEFLRRIKKFSIATIITASIVGVLFIAFPAKCIEYISLVVGATFIVIGAISIISYLINKESVLPLALGIIVAIVGIIICVKYRQIISIIVIIFGIFILTSGIVDLVTSIRSLTLLRKSGWFTMLLSIITIIFGIIAITKSSNLTDTIVQFIGVALVVYAVLDLVTLIQVNNAARKIRQKAEKQNDIVVDATIEE